MTIAEVGAFKLLQIRNTWGQTEVSLCFACV
jgi:hypothetical protein